MRLVSQSGSMRRTALDLGIPPETFRLYVKRRPELTERVYAVLPPQHNYPSDQKLIRLMQQHRSYHKVATEVGVRRESLRDYIERRPELHTAMEAERPPKLSEEHKRKRAKEASRKWAETNRRNNPEQVREARRDQAPDTPTAKARGSVSAAHSRRFALREGSSLG